jgi:prolyl-tRNA editing enzyme YbaK/EbsC (Cys-tRNA(Pro) deacylase)
MISAKVLRVLEAHGLVALEFEPGSTPTAELAARRIGVETARIAKSLLFKGKSGSFHMVVCPGDKRLSSSALKRVIGSRVSMTDADETERVTGYRPGESVPSPWRAWRSSSTGNWSSIRPSTRRRERTPPGCP